MLRHLSLRRIHVDLYVAVSPSSWITALQLFPGLRLDTLAILYNAHHTGKELERDYRDIDQLVRCGKGWKQLTLRGNKALHFQADES